MAALADFGDLDVRIPGGIHDDDYPRAQAALDDASALIRAYTRQHISLVTGDVVTLRGNWSNRLQLPQRPVVAINSLVIKNGSVFVDELPLHFQSDYRWDRLGLVRRVSYVTGRLLAPASGFWGGDLAIIEANYDHGYAEIPAEIQAVCLGLAARRMADPADEHQEQIGGYSVTYERAAAALDDADKAVLENYRRSRRVGSLQT